MTPTAKPLSEDAAPSLDAQTIQALADGFVGKIQQTPPSFSAKKINGRRAHELARKQKPVKLEPVEVEVSEFKLTSVEGSCARFAVECGSGTYIRSLAHDLGRLQGTGGHLAEIVRTAVGEFTLDHAVTLADLLEDAGAGKLEARVIRLENMLPELPRATVLPVVEKRVRHGAKFNLPLAQIQPGHVIAAQGAPAQLDSGEWQPSRLRVFNQQGQLIAILRQSRSCPRTYQPVVVLEVLETRHALITGSAGNSQVETRLPIVAARAAVAERPRAVQARVRAQVRRPRRSTGCQAGCVGNLPRRWSRRSRLRGAVSPAPPPGPIYTSRRRIERATLARHRLRDPCAGASRTRRGVTRISSWVSWSCLFAILIEQAEARNIGNSRISR